MNKTEVRVERNADGQSEIEIGCWFALTLVDLAKRAGPDLFQELVLAPDAEFTGHLLVSTRAHQRASHEIDKPNTGNASRSFQGV
jgi:hypothetical protein